MLFTSYKARLTVLAGMTAAALGALSNSRCYAVDTLLSGFNSSLSSTLGTDWQVVDPGWSTAFVPALSEGAGALRAYHNPGWNFGLKLPGGAPLAQLIANNDSLQLDVVAPYGIQWRQLNVIMNMNHASSGWNQSAEINVSYPTETAPFQNVAIDLAAANGKNWKALAQNWLDNPVPTGDPAWFELLIVFQGPDGQYSADFNFDQGVDAADFMIWQQNYGLVGEASPDLGDANSDFGVDNADLQQWAEQFGRRQADPYTTIDNIKFVDNTPIAAIPEPTTLSVGLVGAALVACGARRRRQSC